jgi:hypothetical protein
LRVLTISTGRYPPALAFKILHTSSPPIFGITTSSSTSAGRSRWNTSSTCCPSLASTTLYPAS